MIKHQEGFTLVEMLAVVAMVSVLSTIVFVSLTTTRSDQELEAARKLLSSELRQVITWSQTGKIEGSSGNLPEGYGIKISPGSDAYIIYAEFDGDKKFQSTGSDVVISQNLLIDSDSISRVQFESCTPATPKCDVYSQINSGELYINGTKTSDLQINLEHVSSGVQSVINMDRSTGQINVP